jgi:hypothetical protein
MSPRAFPRGATAFVPAVLLSGLAFLFACQGLKSADVWWHLRAGEWIIAHGPPSNDPFTYGSADRRWIDLHWLFQIVLAVVHSAAGVPALLVFTASLAAIAVLIGLAAGRGSVSAAAIAFGWVPGLFLMATRYGARPEMATLVFLAAFLAVLVRLDDRPRLAWLLPALQLVWVNMHGLFVCGPVVLALWLIDRGWQLVGRHWEGKPLADAQSRRWWRHVGGATVAVAVACFANPYGVDGATFPLVLLPKITDADNPYKTYVLEFRSPSRDFRMKPGDRAVGPIPAFGFRFLLLLLPVAMLVPATRRISRTGWPAPAVLAVGVLLAAGQAFAIGTELGAYLPAAFLAIGVVCGLVLVRRSDPAAKIAFFGGVAAAVWAWWLDENFVPAGDGTTGRFLDTLLAAAGLIALIHYVRADGALFPVLLTVAFGYLALNSINNLGRFGLVAAVVLGWELGPGVVGSVPARAAVNIALAGWIAAILAGFPSGVPGRLPPDAFAEYPLTYPHDAARFAGRDGMPPYALAVGLPAADVYVYHNAPGKLAYMDGRLEVPTLDTFRQYREIDDALLTGDPRWAAGMARVGDPVLMLAHANYHKGEAAVLASPRWRLVYFDALAAVFLPRGDGELEARFPTHDLAALHFRDSLARSVPDEPGAAGKEAVALGNLGIALVPHPAQTWTARVPALLAAFGRARLALDEGTDPARAWMAVGAVAWAIRPDPRPPAPRATDGWNTFTGVRWSQLSYGLRQAARLDPGNTDYAAELDRSLAARGLTDAGRAAAEWFDAGEAGWRTWTWDLLDRRAAVMMGLGFPDRARAVWLAASNVPAEAGRRTRLGCTYWIERDLAAAAEEFRKVADLDPSSAEPGWALAWIEAERGRAGPALEAVRKSLATIPPAGVRAELSEMEALFRRYVEP